MTADSDRDSELDAGPIGGMLLRFAPMIYGPTVLFTLGKGAVLPLIPVLATRFGADVATAALVVSALVVGTLCGNLPAGWTVSRVGERWTMAGAGVLALAGAIGAANAGTVWQLTVAVFIIGLCTAAFGLARHAFMTTRVPLSFRARALALLGGAFRLGLFVGPFVGAGLLGWFGDEQVVMWFFAGCLVAATTLVVLGPDPETRIAAPSTAVSRAPAAERAGVFATMREHRGVLARVGLAAAMLSAVRSSRQVMVPLWGVSIGLDGGTIALVVGVSGAIDFALFYASGQVMDRFGRLWAALPAMLLMGAGFVALAFTHDLPQNAMWFGMLAAVLGVGNGLSSGILMTLGADLAPPRNPAPFLGSWRTLSDAGSAAAPVLATVLTAVASLSIAVGAIGAIGLLGAAAFARWLPRYVPRQR